jgi:hypothetical protein
MRRTLLAGALLALGAALLAVHGGHLGLEANRIALYGVVLGGVLGLVTEGSPTGRASAFGIGFAAAWAGYALRAGVLPDIPAGRGLVAFLVVAVVTTAAALSRERLPLWAGLLGAGLMVGAYETTFTITPPAFETESLTAATAALLAAAVGYLIATLVSATEPAETGEAQPDLAVTRVVAVPGQRVTPTDVPTRTEA